jgi:hypothetical protein
MKIMELVNRLTQEPASSLTKVKCIDPLNGWTKLQKIKSLNLGIMTRQRRSFLASGKLAIINEADQFGVTQALRKYNLSHSVFS